jgi:hypothetical protein
MALGLATLTGVLGAATGCAGAHAPASTPTSGEATHAPKQLQPRQIIVALAAEARERLAAAKQALVAEYDLVEMGSFPLGSIGLECVVFEVAPDRSIVELLAPRRRPRVAGAEQCSGRNSRAPSRGCSLTTGAHRGRGGAATGRIHRGDQTDVAKTTRPAVAATGTSSTTASATSADRAARRWLASPPRATTRAHIGIAPDAEVTSRRAGMVRRGGASLQLDNSQGHRFAILQAPTS